MQPSTNIRFPSIGDTIVGRYKLERIVARGGMGVVCLARQLSMDREVAVKMVLPQAADDETTLARFEREVHLAKQLRHPNIVELYDFGRTDGGVLYLVMELLQGQDLKERLSDSGRMNVKDAGHIALQVLDALSAAHDRGIVHRDLKPSNVFISKLGRHGDFVKLLDFGIAKSMSKEEADLTAAGQMCGTSAYMAPEMFITESLDLTVDVYAMGLLLLEMLIGQKVFQGATTAENMVLHLQKGVSVPPPLVSTPLGAVIARATARRPGNRYPSAHEMLAALEDALENTPGDFILEREVADAAVGRIDSEMDLFESLLGESSEVVSELQVKEADSSDIIIVDREMGEGITSASSVLRTLDLVPEPDEEGSSSSKIPQAAGSDVHGLVTETEPEDVVTLEGGEPAMLDPSEFDAGPTRLTSSGRHPLQPKPEPVRPEANSVRPEAKTVRPEARSVRPEAKTIKAPELPAHIRNVHDAHTGQTTRLVDSDDATAPPREPTEESKRPPIALFAGAGLVLFVVLVAAGIAVLSGDSEPEEGVPAERTSNVTTEPAEPGELEFDEPVEPEPEPEPAIEEAAVEKKQQPPPANRVMLRVTTTPPGAMATSLAGKQFGITPFRTKLRPQDFPDKLKLELEGYEPLEVSVDQPEPESEGVVVESTLVKVPEPEPEPTKRPAKRDLDEILSVERFD